MLTFDTLVEKLYDSLVKVTFVIRKLASFIPRHCLRMLYYAHCFSRLNYGINVWFPLIKERQRQKLNILQKRLMRSVCCERMRTHCMPLFKKEKILILSDMVFIENAKLMYMIERHQAPLPVINLFPKSKHSYGTQRDSYKVPNFKYKICCNSFLSRAILTWDSLSADLKRKEHIKSFAKSVKNQLLDKY